MKRSWIVGATFLLIALVVSRLASRRGTFSWERMLERMPESIPPKWMFNSIQAIRENTDQILQRMEAMRVGDG